VSIRVIRGLSNSIRVYSCSFVVKGKECFGEGAETNTFATANPFRLRTNPSCVRTCGGRDAHSTIAQGRQYAPQSETRLFAHFPLSFSHRLPEIDTDKLAPTPPMNTVQEISEAICSRPSTANLKQSDLEKEVSK